ncbi:MAG TPA: nitroreductase family protein [Gemmatimonadales bacterium]|jgi:nitroreductase
MDVIEAIHSRRSIRAYTTQPVDRELIEDLIWDAAQAPPPRRGQVPWTFNVIRGAKHIANYGREAKQYAKENRPDEPGWDWAGDPEFEVFWGAPALIVISGRVEDCCRAGENLILSAHARGLGTCWVGSPLLWLRTEGAKAKLRIPPNLSPGAALCLGYPATIPEVGLRERPPIFWVE